MSTVGEGGLPRAHGAPVLQGRFRVRPEDFRVTELPSFEAEGSGEHLLLTVTKRGMNTAHAVRRIAEWAGVQERDVGHAGLKDRHAVATQRFSVWLPGRPDPDPAELELEEGGESLRVVDAARHSRKLARGALSGNRFTLVLRELQGGREEVEARLRAIAAAGVPNYFGVQRFGHGGGNVGKALAMFAGRRVGRDQRAMLLSAARSQLFNQVLAARVVDGSWATGLPDGEVWMLDGSRSVFGPQALDAELAARLQRFDIHPTGPLWGRGELRTSGQARALELQAVADGQSLRLRDGLERAGLEQERRALRLRPEGLTWRWPSAHVLELEFTLPPGTYATALLAELGTLEDAAAAPRA